MSNDQNWEPITDDTEAMEIPGGVLVRSVYPAGYDDTGGEPVVAVTAPCFVPGVQLDSTTPPSSRLILVPIKDT